MLKLRLSRWHLGMGLILIIVVTVLAFTYAPRLSTADTGVEDTADNQEIVAAIQRFYDASLEAHMTGDVSILATALADDPIHARELGAERAAELRAYIAQVSGPEKAADFGYLTSMQNKLAHVLHGERLLAEEMEKAAAEGRPWTDEDRKALADRNYGVEPRLPVEALDTPPFQLGIDAFTSIRVEGDYAYASYERVVLWRAVLKRIDGQWYVVSQRH